MKLPRETEIKLTVPNLHALRRRLRRLGFRAIKARHFESNRIFDFPDLRLRRARCLLRLRFEGARCQVTFKGVPARTGKYKVRSEIESHVADGIRFRQILECLGLQETFRYDKYRTTYRRKEDAGRARPPIADLDETPIGNYLELEGSARWIDAVAREIGCGPKDYITASYAALYFKKCRAEGRHAGNMIFAGRK